MNAAPSTCKANRFGPIVIDSIDRIALACSARSIRGGILSSVRSTGGTNYGNQYHKSGGANAAMKDFHRMPGTKKSVGDRKYINDTGEGVLTYNPRSTTTTWGGNGIKLDIYQMKRINTRWETFLIKNKCLKSGNLLQT